jgi:hypothetical protein
VITLDEVGNIDAIITDLDEHRPVITPVVSIEELESTDIGYQNPVVGNKLMVEIPESETSYTIEVYDSTGSMQIVANHTGRNNNKAEVDLSGKPAGIYIVKVITSRRAYSFRVAKQ